MKRKYVIQFFLIFFMLSLVNKFNFLKAEKDTFREFKRKKGIYGLGGCGLGAIAFGDVDNIKGQVGAITTNNIFFNQSSAISTGTSRCDAEDVTALKENRRETFVYINYEMLKTEMARGNGEHVYALALLLDCNEINEFAQMTKKEYKYLTSVPINKPVVLLNRIKEKIKSNVKLSSTCQLRS